MHMMHVYWDELLIKLFMVSFNTNDKSIFAEHNFEPGTKTHLTITIAFPFAGNLSFFS